MKTWIAAAAALLVSGGIAAADTPHDTVVMGKSIDDIISLDPAESFEYSGNEVVANIYDRLIGFDFKDVSKLHGELAESWSVADDGKTYTFKMRPGVKFQSGNPVTAEDAAFSLQRAIILNKTPAFILQQFGFTKDNAKQLIRATDPMTLTIVTEKQVAPTFFYYCLTAMVASIVDEKTVMQHQKDGDMGNAWLKTANSAGSGAFTLRGWKPAESYTVEANPNWFHGAPSVKRVVVRHMTEAASQRLQLEKGDIDIARELDADALKALSANANVRIESGPKASIFYISFNQKNQYLKKPEVVEALKWLIDYDSIQKNIVPTRYTVHQNFLPMGILGALPDKPYKFDLAKGKELLAKAGLPNGFEVTMDVRSTSPNPEIAQAIQQTWAQAGIKLTLIPGDGKQTLTKYRARQHDIYEGLWGSDYQDPNSNAQGFASNPNNADDSQNKTLAWRNAWDIPDLTKQVDAAVLERDAAKRQAMYEAMERDFVKRAPFAILFQETETIASRANVTGFVNGPSFDADLYYALKKN